MVGDDPGDQVADLVPVPDVTGAELGRAVPSTAGRSSGADRPQATTVAPSRRKRALIPAPMPLPPPVTSTTRVSGVVAATLSRSHAVGYGPPYLTDRQILTAGGGMAITTQVHDGVAEVVVDRPPVNALPVADWFALADAITAAGREPSTRCVVLRAEGKGFNAGVDVKELAERRHPRRRSSASTAAASPRSPPSTTARSR